MTDLDVARRAMALCRYDHRHARRDGRPCEPVDCHAEHAAQIDDLIALAVEVDAARDLSWLLDRRQEWAS